MREPRGDGAVPVVDGVVPGVLGFDELPARLEERRPVIGDGVRIGQAGAPLRRTPGRPPRAVPRPRAPSRGPSARSRTSRRSGPSAGSSRSPRPTSSRPSAACRGAPTRRSSAGRSPRRARGARSRRRAVPAQLRLPRDVVVRLRGVRGLRDHVAVERPVVRPREVAHGGGDAVREDRRGEKRLLPREARRPRHLEREPAEQAGGARPRGRRTEGTRGARPRSSRSRTGRSRPGRASPRRARSRARREAGGARTRPRGRGAPRRTRGPSQARASRKPAASGSAYAEWSAERPHGRNVFSA